MRRMLIHLFAAVCLAAVVRTAGAVELVRNGGFDDGLAEWSVNPKLIPWSPLDGGAVSLHPPSWSFSGTVLFQNLNVTGVAGRQAAFSVKLTKNSAPPGRTVVVTLTYVTAGNQERTAEISAPLNETIEAETTLAARYTFPGDAAKLTKLSLAKEGFGDYLADDASLTIDGVTVLGVPRVDGISPTAAPYGSTVEIVGANFGSAGGLVSFGGSSMGLSAQTWTDSRIVVALAEPARGGAVKVRAGFVESNADRYVEITSPHFTVDVVDDEATVCRGQTADYLVAVKFHNGFQTEYGVNFFVPEMPGLDSFHLTPLKATGFAVLKIDTASLAPGTYPAYVQSLEDTSYARFAPITLNVVAPAQVRFYEWDDDVKVVITEKTVTRQGPVNVFAEAVDASGEPLASDNQNLVRVSVDNPYALFVNMSSDPWTGLQVYAIDDGTATLTATAPDGTTGALRVTVSVPASPKVTSAALYEVPPPAAGDTGIADMLMRILTASPLPPYGLTIDNLYAGTLGFTAEATPSFESFGYTSSGFIGITDWNYNWYDGNSRVVSTFKLRTSAEDPSPTGLVLWHGDTDNGTRYVPLMVVNSPAHATVRGALYSSNENLVPPFEIENFDLEFYQAGELEFTRSGFSMFHPVPFEIGAVPAGTYRIRCVPMSVNVAPRWYPNATAWAGAADVTLSAGQTLDDLYFVFGPAADANGDGVTDIADVVTLTLMTLGLEAPSGSADLNGDGIVDVRDIILALRQMLGLS